MFQKHTIKTLTIIVTKGMCLFLKIVVTVNTIRRMKSAYMLYYYELRFSREEKCIAIPAPGKALDTVS